MANSETGGAFSNNLNWWQDHGPANYDRTHTATISYVWELPFGRGRQFGGSASRAVDLVLGGWAFSGVATFESGLPFTPNISGANQVFADLNQVRADQIGSASVPNPNANLWFNPAAFTAPQSPGRNGDVRHNSLRGPGLYNFDLSLGKIFTVAEGKTLEFKWENYNATNHVNLANPNPYRRRHWGRTDYRSGYDAPDAIRIAFPLLMMDANLDRHLDRVPVSLHCESYNRTERTTQT